MTDYCLGASSLLAIHLKILNERKLLLTRVYLVLNIVRWQKNHFRDLKPKVLNVSTGKMYEFVV